MVRHWGALIGLMGILLIYGAFREHARRLALLVVGASKVVFIALVLSLGQEFLQFQVGVLADRWWNGARHTAHVEHGAFGVVAHSHQRGFARESLRRFHRNANGIILSEIPRSPLRDKSFP